MPYMRETDHIEGWCAGEEGGDDEEDVDEQKPC
jgi:hypothetical protein